MSSLIDPPVDDTYRSLGYALKRAQQALRGHLDTQLRNIGLTTPQYSVLAGLEFSAGLSSAELARRAFVTPQTMQSIIATLERDGLIRRMAHPVHGRVLTTELTPDGRSALRAAHCCRRRRGGAHPIGIGTPDERYGGNSGAGAVRPR